MAKPVYRITKWTEGGAGAHVFVDQLGREVKRASQAVDGRFVVVGNGYDVLGHNTQVCEPYYMGDDEYITRIEYDVLGRIIKSQNPFTDANGDQFYSIDTVEYNGLIRTSRNDTAGLNQKKIQERDPMGNLVKVTDNMDNVVEYSYDALGNMTQVEAPELAAANQDGSTLPNDHNITTITYDSLGRKTSMDDPNKGLWRYTYNGLGELIAQTNAKGEVSCTAYDTLGRKVKRIDNYLGTIPQTLGDGLSEATNGCANPGDDNETAEWEYDVAVNKGKGKLYKSINMTYVGGVPSVGKETTLAYDATYGRLETTTDTIAGINYETVTNAFDDYHRPLTVSYPSHGGNALAVTTTYNELGFAVSLKNAANDDPYYVLLGTDAYGNVVKEQYGNGVTTTRDYDPRSNRLKGIVSYALLDMNGPTVQDLDMAFDVVGNLTARNDHLQQIDETFGYDGLNRLTDMRLTMADKPEILTQVKYDTLGNILEKGGEGVYQYGGSCTVGSQTLQAGPHAVTNITAGSVGLKNASYCYDQNGNMISGDGRTIDYTYFDKPAEISKGSYTTYLDYDAERNRFRRVDDDGTDQTVYTYVGAYEKVEKPNGVVEERHYIGGFALLTRTTVGTQSPSDIQRYLHKDHLGSVTTITDMQGGVVEQHSFDPWGKRRAKSLTDLETRVQSPFESMTDMERTSFTLSALSLTSQFTNKGFTGHEQMDGVGLIHMGGRVYDAEIGRFLSADPFVRDRTNLQGLSRYSYVENSPLSYTDPTGYFLKKTWRKLKKALSKVNAQRLRFREFDPAQRLEKKTNNELIRFQFKKHHPFIRKIDGGVAKWLDEYIADHRWAQIVGSVIATYYGGSYGAAAAAAHIAYVQGADTNHIRQAAATAYVTASVTQGIDGYYGSTWSWQRVAMNGLASGTASAAQGGDFREGFAIGFGVSTLTYANYAMRQQALQNSSLNPDNISGDSAGFFGDGTKLAGARRVVNGGSYLPCVSLMGGCQGTPILPGDARSSFFGLRYPPRSVADYINESFAGPHDWLRNATGSYDALGNGRMFTGFRAGVDTVANYALVIPAAPLAVSAMIPPSTYFAFNKKEQ